jgi:hypothetical protein
MVLSLTNLSHRQHIEAVRSISRRLSNLQSRLRGLALLLALALAIPSYSQVAAENRPAIKLLMNGVRYTAPAGWRVEDEPDLRGVLILEPSQNKASSKSAGTTWRSRILIELNERPSIELAGLSLPAQAAHKDISVLKSERTPKETKQSLVQHPNGFSYGLYDSKQIRQNVIIQETRLVANLQENQKLVITASCAASGCETFKPVLDQFVRTLALRKN